MNDFTQGLLGPRRRMPTGNLFYPDGWSGGLFGLGNPIAQAAAQEQAQRQTQDTALMEMNQRGLAEGADAKKKAIVAGLLSSSPYDDPMASAFGGPSVMGRIAYHGTGAKFAEAANNPLGEFLKSFMGKGEGNQAYGRGTYFAEAKDAAKKYAEYYSKDGQGHVYTAELPDTGYLKWDRPLSESPEAAQALGLSGDALNMTGEKLYEKLWMKYWKDHIRETKNNPDPKFNPMDMASEELQRLGITGIEYLDSVSRGMGTGTSNLVLFDPSQAKITARE